MSEPIIVITLDNALELSLSSAPVSSFTTNPLGRSDIHKGNTLVADVLCLKDFVLKSVVIKITDYDEFSVMDKGKKRDFIQVSADIIEVKQ